MMKSCRRKLSKEIGREGPQPTGERDSSQRNTWVAIPYYDTGVGSPSFPAVDQ